MDLAGREGRITGMKRRAFLAAAAAPLVAAAVPGTTRAARSGGGVAALVTADLESHLVAVDADSGRVLKRIATAPGPRSIEANDFGQALVAHTAHGRLSLVDAARLEVVVEIGGLREPRYTAMHPAERLAYVSDSKLQSVAVIDLARRAVVARVAVPGPARHLSLSPDGGRLWVALGSTAARIAILDTTDPRRPVLRSTITPPFLAHDVVWAPGGEHVWVTSGSRGRIAIYEAHTAKPVALLPAGAPPQHLAFTRSRAYVTSGDDGTVVVHRLDGTTGRTARVPVGSYNVSVSDSELTFGRRLGVTPSLDRGTVCLFTPAGEVRAVRRVARSAHDACLVEAG
jgi:DNA-binding beta-propeller fold protein YncE